MPYTLATKEQAEHFFRQTLSVTEPPADCMAYWQNAHHMACRVDTTVGSDLMLWYLAQRDTPKEEKAPVDDGLVAGTRVSVDTKDGTEHGVYVEDIGRGRVGIELDDGRLIKPFRKDVVVLEPETVQG